MSSRKLNDGLAAASGLRRLTLVPAALLLLFATTVPSSFSQTPARKLIVTASGARLRERPETAAAEVGRLTLGAVVDELERSAERSKVGASEDFWHLVSAPGGARGWVFGGLVAPFDPAGRDALYLKLANERLANTASTFADLSELVRFLDRATREVKSRNALAELELARLVALARSLAAMPPEGMNNPPYKSWTDERDQEIVYSEPAGEWYVSSKALWDLQRKYRDLPVAERIAWEASQTPLPGECEGYLPCYIYKEGETNGRYLKLYPRGAHADRALSKLAESLGYIDEDLRGGNPAYEVPREDRANFRRSLAQLRAQLALVPAAKKARVLGQLGRIARRFP
ncbi:MAG TPA: SH3 domain-containing protein [Pyrinomonadaceae bacterium]|nr:SH3 domain-containing protein [Pyrinomonadaceae bacterium]